MIHWGQSIGPATAEAVTRLMAENRHPEPGYRACLGLLSLSKRYGKVRLEAVCMLALKIGACVEGLLVTALQRLLHICAICKSVY